jgi:hypothetical protein
MGSFTARYGLLEKNCSVKGVELCCGSPDPAKEDCGVHTPKRATPNSDILRWRSYIIYKNAIMYIYIYVTYIIQ